MLEQSSNSISKLTSIERKRVLRALILIRTAMAKDIPNSFQGIVEVDETYIGGKWKNKRKPQRDRGTKRGRGTSKQPIFGIYCRNGTVWAGLVDDVNARTLQTIISYNVKKKSKVYSDTWKGYIGLNRKGYQHACVNHLDGEYVCGKDVHINGMEGFWGYLKRKLVSKGGIRRERLWMYLAEYVWRYNHRKLNSNQQINRLLFLLHNGG